jgi:hypothetical protein
MRTIEYRSPFSPPYRLSLSFPWALLPPATIHLQALRPRLPGNHTTLSRPTDLQFLTIPFIFISSFNQLVDKLKGKTISRLIRGRVVTCPANLQSLPASLSINLNLSHHGNSGNNGACSR